MVYLVFPLGFFERWLAWLQVLNSAGRLGASESLGEVRRLRRVPGAWQVGRSAGVALFHRCAGNELVNEKEGSVSCFLEAKGRSGMQREA